LSNPPRAAKAKVSAEQTRLGFVCGSKASRGDKTRNLSESPAEKEEQN